MVANIQIELEEGLQKMLLKEASKKKVSVSQLISDLLENYLLDKTTKKKRANAMKMLRELAETAPEPPMSDDDMMDFINSEIKAMRAERQAH